MENLVKKKRVLIFVGGYLPGFRFGGPVRSISNMVDSLGDNFDFYIITLDRDLGAAEMYSCIEKNEFNKLDGCLVRYLSKTEFNLVSIRSLIKDVNPDLIYGNGFFGRDFCLRLILLKAFFNLKQPILVAPRGEFSRGALSIKSFRKRIYLWFFRGLNFHKLVHWHATNSIEKKEIQTVFGSGGDLQIHTASNIPKKPNPSIVDSWPDKSNTLSIAFLSRISPKKNLLYAIELLQRIDFSVSFCIYGTIEDKQYWKLCQQSIQRLPANIEVIYGGELLPQDVIGVLSSHDVFLFPTLGENYGHVIFEALSAGMIVLTSDRTPWGEIERGGAGWCVPLVESEKYVERLTFIHGLDEESLRNFRRDSLLFTINYSENDRSIMDTESSFNKVFET